MQFLGTCYDRCPNENAMFLQKDVIHSHYNCIYGCAQGFSVVNERKICGSCSFDQYKRKISDTVVECVQAC